MPHSGCLCVGKGGMSHLPMKKDKCVSETFVLVLILMVFTQVKTTLFFFVFKGLTHKAPACIFTSMLRIHSIEQCTVTVFVSFFSSSSGVLNPHLFHCPQKGFFHYFGSFHRTEVVRLYFFIRCKRENSRSQITSDVRSGFKTILPRHLGWQTSVIGSNYLIT